MAPTLGVSGRVVKPLHRRLRERRFASVMTGQLALMVPKHALPYQGRGCPTTKKEAEQVGVNVHD
jgi:hypothetical protein